MYYCRIVRSACSTLYWSSFVENRLAELKLNFETSKHGLDLSKSGFLKSEVFKADECICVKQYQKTLGFVFIFTHKRPRALYITLMVSFRSGIGSALIHFLEVASIYNHEFISLRATSNSVGFYMKQNFKVFDFITMEDYVNGRVSESITEQICLNLDQPKKLQDIQKKIIDIDWIHENSDEFPLLKKRISQSYGRNYTRRSPRFEKDSSMVL